MDIKSFEEYLRQSNMAENTISVTILFSALTRMFPKPTFAP